MNNNETQNAYQFIIDSINDGHSIDEIEFLDDESKFEFAETYETTRDAIDRAINTMRMIANRIS